MKTVFMGTPQIAADVLRSFAAYSKVCGVFCQPDKPVGRKAILTPPPVKMVAQALGIPVFQPEKMRDGEALRQLQQLQPDLIVVVAYGKILPQEILDLPPYGCVNLHTSLLPKYRGAAPMQHALLNGETETGMTAMFMDAGLDTGDIIAQRPLTIAPEDDAASLYAKATACGVVLLREVYTSIADGTVTRTPQKDAEATFAPPLTKAMGLFCWQDDAQAIVNKVRAFARWPVAYFFAGNKKIKVHRAAVLDLNGKPGEIVASDPLTVAAKNGAVALVRVTPEGSREMSGKDFAAGRRLQKGDILD